MGNDGRDIVDIGPLDPVKWFGLALFIVEREQEEMERMRKEAAEEGGLP